MVARMPSSISRKNVSATQIATTIQAPKDFKYVRVTPIGPHNASAVQSSAKSAQPQVLGRPAENLAGHDIRNQRHGPELDSRPTDELSKVQRAGNPRSPDAEQGAEKSHRRHAFAGADRGGYSEGGRPDDRADEDGPKRGRERQGWDQQPAGYQDEKADAQIPPQDRKIKTGEPPLLRGEPFELPLVGRSCNAFGDA